MDKNEIQKQALESTENKQRCGIVMGTGVGKTLVGLRHMSKTTTALMKVLVVAPKRSIFTSWKDDAIKFGMEKLLDRITFSTYLSINKHDPNDYDAVYLDECHSLLDSHRGFLQLFKGKILGLTGTPPKRTWTEKGKMVNEFCPIVFTFKADDAIGHGILNDYKIIVHELYLSDANTYQVKTKHKSFMSSESKNYAYWSTRLDTAAGNVHMLRVMRMKAMMEYPSKEQYARLLFADIKSKNSKCILFANTQDQADRLCQYSYHSNNVDSDNNLEMFKSGLINQLSSVMQLNEGVNIPELKQGIIMHSYGNERKSSQRIGRLLRLNPDDTAIVHILCYKNTIDEKWVKDALEEFDQSKITWIDFKIQDKLVY